MKEIAKTESAVPENQKKFRNEISSLVRQIAGKELNQEMSDWLNSVYGVHTQNYQTLKMLCQAGVKEGWLCNREGGGIKFGRVFKAAEDLAGFSVDVVDMENIAGPHHRHPLGEIDLIMPIEGDALFDGAPAGWMVAPAASAHSPTVSNGRALIMYLLPQGKIEFTQ